MESVGKRKRSPPNWYANEVGNTLGQRTKQKSAAASSTKAKKASTNASRGKLLKKELAKYNLTRRKDSLLCDAFVKGTTTKSVEEVATTMCRMKYLYEGFCKSFNEELSRVEDEIEEEVENLAAQCKRYKTDPFSDFDGYYRGIRGDACSEITGYYSLSDYKLDLASSWTMFPEQWPWM